MNQLLSRVLSCDDINAVKSVVTIMAESASMGLTGEERLAMLKNIQAELTGSHYDEELASLHLALIGQQCSKDTAMHYWSLSKKQQTMTACDWLVLWGEMTRRHGNKIRKWFPRITNEDFNDKVFDECLSFLESGGDPFNDLNP